MLEQEPTKSEVTICELNENLLNAAETDIDAKLEAYNTEQRRHIVVDRSKGRIWDDRHVNVTEEVTKSIHLGNSKFLWESQEYILQPIEVGDYQNITNRQTARTKSIWSDNWDGHDKAHHSLLQTIIHNQAYQFMTLLEQEGTQLDINYKYQSNWTALHYAAMHATIQIISKLINHPRIDLTVRTSFGQTALHIAVKANKLDNCLLLTSAQVEVNARDEDGNTALHYAAELGHRSIVELLLESKADTSIKNCSGIVARELASAQIVKILPVQKENEDESPLYGNRPTRRNMVQRMLAIPEQEQSQVKVVPKPSNGREKKEPLRKQNLFKLYKLISMGPKAEVSLSSFSFYKKIGEGAFGQVYIVKREGEDRMYALKAIKKQRVIKSNLYRYIQTEKDVLSYVSHPFIVKLRFAFQSDSHLFLAMDFAEGGDLSKLLEKRRRFDEVSVRNYACQILLAMEALHKNNIIYRDLKPENIVLDRQGHALLTDFGLSKKTQNIDDLNKSFCGTPAYLPLEIINRKGHTRMADWYEFGVVLYELYTGFPPYYADNKQQLYEQVRKGYIRFSRNTPEIFKDLVKRLLAQNPERRLGYEKDAVSIREHPWFADVDWEAVIERRLTMPSIDNKLKIGPPIRTKFVDGKSEKDKIPMWSFIE